MIPVINVKDKSKVSWEAFVQEFGEPRIKPLPADTTGWRVVRLEIDRRGPVGLIVTTLAEDDQAQSGNRVAFYWQDADADSNCGPAGGVLAEMRSGRCISAETKEDGTIDFAMGIGAYYSAKKGEIGPHAAWIYGADQPSEVIFGLGMLVNTEHWHYNVVFQWTGEQEPEEPDPEEKEEEQETEEQEEGEEEPTPVVPPKPGEPGQLCLEKGQVKISTELYDVPFPVPIEFRGCPVTGRGVHWGSDWHHKVWLERWEFWTKWAREMHLSWAVTLSASDSALVPHAPAGGRSAVQTLLDAGIIPIVRIGSLLPGGYTHVDHVKTLARQVEPYGVPGYLLIGNEFGDPREWRRGKVPRDWLPKAFGWWIGAARTCLQHGVYVGFPDGPDYDDDIFAYCRKLPSMRDDDGEPYASENDVADFFSWWKQGKVFYAGHFYGLNRPPDFPYDDVSRQGTPLDEDGFKELLKDDEHDWYPERHQDPPLFIINEQRADKAWERHGRPRSSRTASWNAWRRVVEWMDNDPDLPSKLPMALTEGGWTPNAIAGTTPETIDARWPKPIPGTVAKYTVQAFDQIEHPMFAQCPWTAADKHMEGPTTWESDAWYTDHYKALGYDMSMPVVHKLRESAPRLLKDQFNLSEA